VRAGGREFGIPLISDGGIKFSETSQGHRRRRPLRDDRIVFAGTDEAPGETILYQGRTFKA